MLENKNIKHFDVKVKGKLICHRLTADVIAQRLGSSASTVYRVAKDKTLLRKKYMIRECE